MSKKPANVQRKALKELEKGWRNTEQNLKHNVAWLKSFSWY